MASANTFTSLQPIFKESYGNKIIKTHERPGKEILFKKIKDRLKKNKK